MKFRRVHRPRHEPLEQRELLAAEIGIAADSAAMEWWADANPVQAALRQPTDAVVSEEISPIRTQAFRLLTLQRPQMEDALSALADEAGTRSIKVAIPRPDGTMDRFGVSLSEVMSPDLAATFPMIQTFVGVSESGSGDRLFADLSPGGFHAMVVSTGGSYFVDPFYYFDDRLYASYFAELPSLGVGLSASASDSDDLDVHRIYRTAITASEQYTRFHGGTAVGAQSAIVTAIQRVSGMFESQSSVRLQLVAQGEPDVAMAWASNPQGSLAGSSMVEPFAGGQTIDLRHVLTTETPAVVDAGIALDVAGGVTRLANPIGDAADVFTIAANVSIQLEGGGALEDGSALDFGDAPSVYPVALSADGARHQITGLTLGAAIDGEPDGIAGPMATDEGRDDDGVVFRELFLPGKTTSIDVTASAAGVLDFFIDFDGNGVFGNVADEVFSTPVAAGTQAVAVNVPETAVEGVTYGRFRLSTAGGLGPTGAAPDGEVEDYQLVVIRPISEVLWQDFDTVTVPQLPIDWESSQIGNAWRTEAGTGDTVPNSVFAPNIDSISDVTLDSPPLMITRPDTVVRFRNAYDTEAEIELGAVKGYDGGVLEISIGGSPFEDILAAGGVFLEGGYNATIEPGFGNPLAGRAAWSGNSGGFIQTAVQLPADAAGQTVQMRWRLGTDSSVPANGWRIDTISYSDEVIEFDFGDALGSGYPTTAAQNGAAHAFSLLSLGFFVDYESDGLPTELADGDDVSGLPDEDGVQFPATLAAGTQSIQIDASGSAIVNVWIDVDADGTWASAVDHVIKDVPVGFGINNLSFDLPANLVTGKVAARVRLSQQAGLAPGGRAGDGEVEDYLVDLLGATPVVVQSVQINHGSQQRSLLTSLTVTLSENTAATPEAFVVERHRDGSPVAIETVFSVVGDKTVATITFLPGPSVQSRGVKNSLADGQYRLTVLASGIAGMKDDHLFGDDPADSFFRLFGDSDGDRDVDGQDYGRLGVTFLKRSGDSSFDPNFDYDGDGDVDGVDFGQFGRQFLKGPSR